MSHHNEVNKYLKELAAKFENQMPKIRAAIRVYQQKKKEEKNAQTLVTPPHA